MFKYQRTSPDDHNPPEYDVIEESSAEVRARLVLRIQLRPGAFTLSYDISTPGQDTPDADAVWFIMNHAPIKELYVAEAGAWRSVGKSPE